MGDNVADVHLCETVGSPRIAWPDELGILRDVFDPVLLSALVFLLGYVSC